MEQFSRTELLIGKENIQKLKNSHIAIFGIGGVGGHCAEALVRCGIGAIDLIDSDKVAISNINRQIVALHSTIGKYKVDVAKERFLDINPSAVIKTYKMFYLPENAKKFDFSQYDYIIDAIDTVKAKISLIEQAKKVNVPIICALGAGNKINPADFIVSDISKTSVCPLARVIRIELKKRGIKKVKVVYSKEIPIKPSEDYPSSIAFCPSTMGLIMAGEAVKDLINFNRS